MTVPGISGMKFYAIENKDYTEFSPLTFGAERCLSGKSFGPYIRNYYLIHFAVDGEGIFKSPAGTKKVKSGQAFLIRPGEVCTYTADKENPWVYIWIGFKGKLAGFFDTTENVFDVSSEILSDILFALDEESGQEEYLTGVLFKLYSSFLANRMQRDRMKQTADFINANYMRDIKVADIAALLGINRKYLARSFKKKYGQTVREYIMEKRLYEGKKLLESGESVGESAAIVGYSDSFTFSKAFKKRYGTSPLGHKKSMNKNGV